MRGGLSVLEQFETAQVEAVAVRHLDIMLHSNLMVCSGGWIE